MLILRAGLYLEKLEKVGLRKMSTDFNPTNDRQRIQHVAYQRPELLRHPHTKEKLFNRSEDRRHAVVVMTV